VDVPGKRVVDAGAIQRLTEAAERVLARQPDVVAAYLHGSAARGEPAADLDIAVLLRRAAPDLRELDALAAVLQAEGAPAGPQLDVRPLSGTSPRFRANVLREGRLIYEADRKARLDFEAQAYAEWLDFKPVWERMRGRMRDRWVHG
jgi:uncharacterized protein